MWCFSDLLACIMAKTIDNTKMYNQLTPKLSSLDLRDGYQFVSMVST